MCRVRVIWRHSHLPRPPLWSLFFFIRGLMMEGQTAHLNLLLCGFLVPSTRLKRIKSLTVMDVRLLHCLAGASCIIIVIFVWYPLCDARSIIPNEDRCTRIWSFSDGVFVTSMQDFFFYFLNLKASVAYVMFPVNCVRHRWVQLAIRKSIEFPLPLKR